MFIKTAKSIDKPLYDVLKSLEKKVTTHDDIHLKIELEYKHHSMKNEPSINEFMCYTHEGDAAELIGYIGILAFGSSAEVSGMVDPAYRRQGVFSALFEHVKVELASRKFEEVLLLADQRSSAGKYCIENLGGIYLNSEYEMTYTSNPLSNRAVLKLTSANQDHIPVINAIDVACFGERYTDSIDTTYVALLKDRIVGKVRLEVLEGEGGIFGLGVLPEYRGRGYGKALLENSVAELKTQGAERVFLQVLTENENALGLYLNTGFKIDSRMDYYQYTLG